MKKTKIILLAVFITLGFFGFGETRKAFAINYECEANIDNFDANPKDITSIQGTTISGSMTGRWQSQSNTSVTCDFSGVSENVTKFVVAIYDTASNRELRYMEFPMMGGVSDGTAFKREYTFTSLSLVPKDLNITGNSMQLEAHVKIFSSDNKSKVLAVSAPVNISIKQSTAPAPATGEKTPEGATTPASGGGTNGDCTDPNKCLYNPLPTDVLTDMLLLIMQGFLMIVGIWSVAFVIIGGFRYVMSQGNEEAITAARKTITWAILGLVIALMSFSIIAIVKNIFKVENKKVGISQQNQEKL